MDCPTCKVTLVHIQNTFLCYYTGKLYRFSWKNKWKSALTFFMATNGFLQCGCLSWSLFSIRGSKFVQVYRQNRQFCTKNNEDFHSLQPQKESLPFCNNSAWNVLLRLILQNLFTAVSKFLNKSPFLLKLKTPTFSEDFGNGDHDWEICSNYQHYIL